MSASTLTAASDSSSSDSSSSGVTSSTLADAHSDTAFQQPSTQLISAQSSEMQSENATPSSAAASMTLAVPPAALHLPLSPTTTIHTQPVTTTTAVNAAIASSSPSPSLSSSAAASASPSSSSVLSPPARCESSSSANLLSPDSLSSQSPSQQLSSPSLPSPSLSSQQQEQRQQQAVSPPLSSPSPSSSSVSSAHSPQYVLKSPDPVNISSAAVVADAAREGKVAALHSIVGDSTATVRIEVDPVAAVVPTNTVEAPPPTVAPSVASLPPPAPAPTRSPSPSPSPPIAPPRKERIVEFAALFSYDASVFAHTASTAAGAHSYSGYDYIRSRSALKGIMQYRLPQKEQCEKNNDLPEALEHFVFPTGLCLETQPQQPMVHSFVLTLVSDSDAGEKQIVLLLFVAMYE